MDRGAELSEQALVEPRRGLGSAERGLTGSLSRVRFQVFPLAAERAQLQTFCDEWFNNLIPPEVAVFRPAFPFVFCTALHYGEMGTDFIWKTGVLTQNELYFLVPLDRYRWRDGRLEFVEHCATTPYIFVDNSLSAVAGRERFGFPKQECRFNATSNDLRSIADAERYLSLSTWEPSTSGRRLRPLLEIVRAPVPWFGVALDRSAGEPMLTSRGGLFDRFDMFWFLRTLLGEWRARTDPGPANELAGQFEELMEMFRTGPGLSIYNLRQFAHPTTKFGAHYQDLVRFRMSVRGVQEFSFFLDRLGSADFSVFLQKTAVQPIADRLGLTVFSRQRGPLSEGRPTVDVLRAFFPAFGQADVSLSSTERLCWRFQHSAWYDDDGTRLTERVDELCARYNDYLGPSASSFLEPQPEQPIVDVRFLMLPARTAAVRDHLRSRIPADCPIRIQPISVGEYTALRLLVSRSRPRMADEQQGLVWLDGNYASLAVPVEYEYRGSTQRALFLLHDFTDNGFRLQALREIAGAPTELGEFDTTSGDWFASTQDTARIASLHATAINRSATEALLTRTPLLDVFAVNPGIDDRSGFPDFASPLRRELWEMTGSIQPNLSFSSIPAPGNPERAVFQRLMWTEITDHELLHKRSPDPSRPLYVQFHESETFPIVRRLGLLSLPSDDPLALRLRQGDGGSCAVVPVIAGAEAGARLTLAWMQILWQRVVA
jgi:hypothetical protein